LAEGVPNIQCVNIWIRLTQSHILKSHNTRSGRRLNEYSVSEFVDQAEIELNIEIRNARSGRRLNKYSVSEIVDQAEIESNIGIRNPRGGQRFLQY
jgi:hypothetical protein